MATYVDTKCRLCRREGVKLFLKGARCEGQMCAVTRRQTIPGGPTKSRRSVSDYGWQLREKQKVKRWYLLREKQFRNLYGKALKARGATGEILLSFLERRLDNVAYRLGWGLSRKQARQLVTQGKVAVNGVKAKTPSRSIKAGDTLVFSGLENFLKKEVKIPAWLKVQKSGFAAKVTRLPERADAPADFREQLIVEFYSR